MSTKELDNYCQKLLQAFIGSNKRWHFNEFHEKLNKASLKISKPTLSQHLKHLQKLKLITRKREGKQRISYGVNWEKLKHLQKTVDGLHAIKRILENETTFSTLRIQEQVMYLIDTLTLRNLEMLKLEILDILEPDKNFEHNVQYGFTNQFFDLFRTWFIKNCYKTTKENKLIALKIVENNIKHFEKDLFVRKPWKSQNKDASNITTTQKEAT